VVMGLLEGRCEYKQGCALWRFMFWHPQGARTGMKLGGCAVVTSVSQSHLAQYMS
jgi:hypothetical protein